MDRVYRVAGDERTDPGLGEAAVGGQPGRVRDTDLDEEGRDPRFAETTDAGLRARADPCLLYTSDAADDCCRV